MTLPADIDGANNQVRDVGEIITQYDDTTNHNLSKASSNRNEPCAYLKSLTGTLRQVVWQIWLRLLSRTRYLAAYLNRHLEPVLDDIRF